MKTIKNLLYCLVCAGFAFAGCETEAVDPFSPEADAPTQTPVGKYELVASISNVTKTALNGVKLSWEAGDVIYVWTGAEFTPYTTVEGDGKFNGDKEIALLDGKHVALYPAATVDGTKATFEIGQEQAFAVAKANDLPMVATWNENASCIFAPVCSILSMPLTVADGVTLKSIAYDFNGNVGAGTYTYDWINGAYAVTPSEGNDITLTGTFAANATEAVNVYNPIIPGDYTEGFTLTLTDADNCAMILTVAKGKEIEAGAIQPLGSVDYKQLAPKFTIAYDDWAATATLVATPGANTKYWLSKELNGGPLTGVAPVNMSSLEAGASVKLYGYLCSENVAATGVKDGDKLYFVTEYVDGPKRCLRSVEYTYHPDPLEVVLYNDDFHTMVQRSGGAASSIITSTRTVTDYTEDVAFGEKSMFLDFDKWTTFRMRFWSSGDYPSWDAQEADEYCFEFYMKPSVEMNNNYFSFLVRFEERDGTTITERRWSTKYLKDFHGPTSKNVPANKWTKISIPMSKLQCDTSGDPKAKANSYKAVGTIESYYGHDFSTGNLTKWCTNYKCVTSIDLNNLLGDTQYTMVIDYMTIRKSTLNQ